MTVLGRSLLLVVVVSAATAAGCSGDDGTPAAPTGTAAAPSTTAAPTTAPVGDTVTVQVFFVDQNAFNEGRAPFVTPVERDVAATDPPRGALDALFDGPSEDEQARGLRLVPSEATGVSELRIEQGTAHVTLAGGCSSGGSTLTVADEIVATLLQFPDVRAVKIYDPEGRTESPGEPGDSIPECLEP